jgi:penicillin-binding protein 1C
LPNSPGLISPVINRKYLIKKRNRLLKILMKRKIISAGTYRLSIEEPIPETTSPFFITAPHLAQTLKSRFNIQSGFIYTTIQKKYQTWIENLIAQYLKYLSPRGIRNGAILVAETPTGKVRAYVGSQNFFDETNEGQNDGVISPRSTGSILKPFLYAAAIDEGLILPQTRIQDIPSYFGSFSPSNANKKYSGLVTAKEALIRSLNVPASRLLNAFGLNKFYLFLKSAGLSTLFRKPDEYGLTLILGGAEATLMDLTRIYCGLGNYGNFIPLELVYSENPSEENHYAAGPALLSPEASFLTLQMLKDVKRPGSEFYWEQYQSRYPIAWKTGTSYGQKDAWSIGVTPQWTIGVWIGNFDGEGNSDLSGASCAAPLMFEIFNYLPKPPGRNWFPESKLKFKSVKLCSDTGFIAGPDCSRTYTARAPHSVKPLKTCPYHRAIFTTMDEKFEVCSLCWKSIAHKKISRLFFPPDVTQYLRESGVILSDIPPHKTDCPAYSEHRTLQIIYPVPNANLWIPYDFNGNLQKVTLKVAHRVKNRAVFWYLDNIYRGVTRSKHKMAFDMGVGWHILEVVDAEGYRDKRKFHVSIRSPAR